jgi:protein-tyrosine phosphatase
VRPFSILYVCVANVCRSVLAERLTRREAELRLGRHRDRLLVSSAGTCARPGDPMHPYTAATLEALGVDAGGSAARRLGPECVEAADLVLTATADQRDEVLGMLPVALRRTFTLLEFARLSAHLPGAEPVSPADFPDAARVVVATVAGTRGRTQPADDDIPDPDRKLPAFRSCADVIAGAVRTVAAALPAVN